MDRVGAEVVPQLTAHLEKRFAGGHGVGLELKLPLDPPSVTVLFGPSGAGKTTVLRCLAGLEDPDEGTIAFAGETWFEAARARSLPPQRRRVGFLFQDNTLFPHLSVLENVTYGLGGNPVEDRARATDLLGRLGLAGSEPRLPSELSGGQRQRVALARALAPRPRLLLLDEPLSALDAPTRDRLRGELRRHLSAAGVPSIVVTHDRLEALTLGDRIAVLSEGRLLEVGPVAEVFGRPVDVEVARIVGVETVVSGRVVELRDGLAVVEAGGTRLMALGGSDLPAEVLVCIRAEEVLVERGPAGQLSARNHLRGRVAAVTPEGPLFRVSIDCGFLLDALVTRPACEELGLREGEEVRAVVKAPAVHLVPRQGRS